ncbi:carbohydrate ABC transporter membrane protein 2, CUT1 family [Sanguibacter gelidistatuariae]|uniref:Carbohydrate ABC transporter membrane protein 2, CUT1 family n=1 Tax=Sanguibacter gelidistatuariae TaxID=1814289 RepID=A0A1G6GV38_9MICO|nr:carbohydrate ABC transporter permease [Sanguibacter gelidistatuariae]SDB85877.1 carbohydrate ABC transporter membrane protein 2, CUT1 family [Sanguibacter gelidistatuariae]
MSTTTAPTTAPRPVRRPRLVAGHILAWAYGALLLIPLYYLLVSAFKPNIEIFDKPFALPTGLSLKNFASAWERASLGTALSNSILITASAALLTLALAIPASYALARSRGRLGTAIERLFSMGFLIPGFAALVPTVLLAIALGMFQTRLFVILFMPATALPLSVVLLTQFMRTVPAELEESAVLDGANRWMVLKEIYLPIAMPGIATVTILNVLNFWNEYLFTLILGGPNPNVRTAQVALPTLVSQTSTDYGVLAAGTLLTLLPVYIAYILLSRQMENALLQGAVKG